MHGMDHTTMRDSIHHAHGVHHEHPTGHTFGKRLTQTQLESLVDENPPSENDMLSIHPRGLPTDLQHDNSDHAIERKQSLEFPRGMKDEDARLLPFLPVRTASDNDNLHNLPDSTKEEANRHLIIMADATEEEKHMNKLKMEEMIKKAEEVRKAHYKPDPIHQGVTKPDEKPHPSRKPESLEEKSIIPTDTVPVKPKEKEVKTEAIKKGNMEEIKKGKTERKDESGSDESDSSDDDSDSSDDETSDDSDDSSSDNDEDMMMGGGGWGGSGFPGMMGGGGFPGMMGGGGFPGMMGGGGFPGMMPMGMGGYYGGVGHPCGPYPCPWPQPAPQQGHGDSSPCPLLDPQGKKICKPKKSNFVKRNQGLNFDFMPHDNCCTEVELIIEPEDPDPLECSINNGIMPIVCCYMPPCLTLDPGSNLAASMEGSNYYQTSLGSVPRNQGTVTSAASNQKNSEVQAAVERSMSLPPSSQKGGSLSLPPSSQKGGSSYSYYTSSQKGSHGSTRHSNGSNANHSNNGPSNTNHHMHHAVTGTNPTQGAVHSNSGSKHSNSNTSHHSNSGLHHLSHQSQGSPSHQSQGSPSHQSQGSPSHYSHGSPLSNSQPESNVQSTWSPRYSQTGSPGSASQPHNMANRTPH